MPSLVDLALQYGKDLDGDTEGIEGIAAWNSGVVALVAVEDAIAAVGGHSALEPIILLTTLAASIVRYYERITWVVVTPQLLYKAGGHFSTKLTVSCNLLMLLMECSRTTPVDAVKCRLLQQVRSQTL